MNVNANANVNDRLWFGLVWFARGLFLVGWDGMCGD